MQRKIIGIAIIFVSSIILIFALFWGISQMVGLKKDVAHTERNQKQYTSTIEAYSIGNVNGTDAIKLKDGTQFEDVRFVIGRSNFLSNVKCNKDTIKEGYKVTYIKKDNLIDKSKKYKILKIEDTKGRIINE